MKPRANPMFRAAALLLLAGCASAPVVDSQVQPGADLARYATYAWGQEPQTRSPLVRQHLVDAIDAQLQGKGWQKVVAPGADVVVVALVAAREDQRVDSEPEWSGGAWHGVNGLLAGYTPPSVSSYQVGTLVIDLVDTHSQQAVWRATAEGVVPSTPQKVNAAIDSTIPRMFAQLPSRAP